MFKKIEVKFILNCLKHYRYFQHTFFYNIITAYILYTTTSRKLIQNNVSIATKEKLNTSRYIISLFRFIRSTKNIIKYIITKTNY